MKRSKVFALLVILLSYQLMQFPNSQAQEQAPQKLIYGLPYDFAEYTWFTIDSYASAQWMGAVYSGLYQRTSENNYNYIPDLAAKSPIISDDKTTYTIDLKHQLQFSNQEPLTADDVVFSYQVLLTPSINTYTYHLLARYFDSNSSIIKIDEDTVEFTLKQPYVFAMKLFTQPIIPKQTYQNEFDDCLEEVNKACNWNEKIGSFLVSAGPYFASKLDFVNHEIILKKNPYYWNNRNVWASEIVFTKIETKNEALESISRGRISIMDAQYVLDVNDGSEITTLEHRFIGELAHQEYALNHLHPYFGTGEAIPDTGKITKNSEQARLLRKAMSHIVDRNEIIKQILGGLGEPASTVMPSVAVGHDSTIPYDLFNITYAKNLMENIGFDYSTLGTPDEDGRYLSYFFNITLLSPNSGSSRNQWPSMFGQTLPKIGIGIAAHVSTGWDVIIPRTFGYEEGLPPIFVDGGFDIFAVGYSWDLDWNPIGHYTKSGLCDTGSCENFYNYQNETVEQLINNYNNEYNYADRISVVKDLQELLKHDYPVIPILYPQSHWIWHADLENIDPVLLGETQQNWGSVKQSNWDSPGIAGNPEKGIHLIYTQMGKAVSTTFYETRLDNQNEPFLTIKVNYSSHLMLVLSPVLLSILGWKRKQEILVQEYNNFPNP